LPDHVVENVRGEGKRGRVKGHILERRKKKWLPGVHVRPFQEEVGKNTCFGLVHEGKRK